MKSNFSLSEFRCKCGKCVGHTPTQIYYFLQLVRPTLEVIREIMGSKPIYINSGIRCIAHNRNVGGAVNSMHLDGLAVDIRGNHFKPNELFKFLNANRKALKITELILYSTFVHIGFRANLHQKSRIG